MVALKGSSLLSRCRWRGPCAGASRYFRMVCQPMRRCRSILRIGQCSDQYRRCRSLICSVESMVRLSVIRQKPLGYQDVVVCKIPAAGVCAAEVLPEPRLAPELSCCLQDSGGRRRAARPLRRNALGRKLSCCLQDRADAAFGPERAAAGGSARRPLGVARDTAASNRDCGSAISEDCPGIPGGIPDRRRSSGGDNRRGAAAGSRHRRRPTARAETSMAGRLRSQ